MNPTKIIGWLTFLIGIIIIGSTLYFTYNIFTGKAAIPQIFEIKANQQTPSQEVATGIQGEIQNMLSERLNNLIPLDSVTKFSNLTVWTIGAWILITGGAKLSELGIRLISVRTNQES